MWPMLDVKKSDPICLHGGTSVYMSEVSQKQQQKKKTELVCNVNAATVTLEQSTLNE